MPTIINAKLRVASIQKVLRDIDPVQFKTCHQELHFKKGQAPSLSDILNARTGLQAIFPDQCIGQWPPTAGQVVWL